MLWRVNVGGDNCLYELDPFVRAPTGNKICVLPWAGISQRGLAYDVLSDTYYVGGWNEGVIYHIDGGGNILDSTSVAIPISGLAYNSRTGHLFALTNHGPPPLATFDVFVFDAKNGMTVIGGFNVTQDGQPIPGLLANGGAGMEIDCDGHLWLVDQSGQLLFEVASGEIERLRLQRHPLAVGKQSPRARWRRPRRCRSSARSTRRDCHPGCGRGSSRS